MRKFLVFNLYMRNEHGAHQPAIEELKEVYLADDVDALLKKLSDARLDWSMGCACNCPACGQFDTSVMDLMAG